MSDNKKESFFKRLTKATQYTVSGVTPKDWFGPSQPIAPIAQQAEGRQFDYPFAYNQQSVTRPYEQTSFQDLRILADNCDILRVVIETRKDQLSRFKFKFQLKDKSDKKVVDKRCTELEEFFASPDKIHTWDEWLRALVEDLFVIDAPALYPRLTYSNRPYSFELMDGATIKPVLDINGRKPVDGVSPAYQQILKGLPAIDYTNEELVYKPRNLRTNRVYGYSPVEQIINTINLQIRKTANQLGFYSQGNTPNLLLRVPEEWSPDQIRKFQIYWDEMNSGVNKNTAKFVPNGIDPFDTKPMEMKNEFDEWLARIICFAFSISPQALSQQMNRATAQTAQESSLEEGLYPVMEWVRNLINSLINNYFGYKDIEFMWDIEEETNPEVKAKIDTMYIQSGVKTVNEVRAELGLEPLSDEELAARQPAPVVADEGAPFQSKMAKKKRWY